MQRRTKFLQSLPIVLLLSIYASAAFSQDAEADMKKLVNYKRMVSKNYPVYKKQRNAQFKSWTDNKIPENFRIPVDLQSFRDNNSVRYYALFNPLYKTGVGYIPSNLAQLYEEEAWFAFQQLGVNAPSLSIVLAQQFTESAFNPLAMGDKNLSCGLPQLYRKTAKFLYKTDKEFWNDYFYFDKKGRHHFKDVRAMVKFPFVFLPKVKQYNSENKFDAIRSYNGAGVEAKEYAEKVMVRSLFYEELFAKYNAIPIDTTGFKNNLFDMINLTFLARSEEPLDQAIMDQLFSNALAEFYAGYIPKTYVQYYLVPVLENQPLLAAQKGNFIIPVDSKEYYIVVEDGKVIYEYFNDSQILLDVLNHKNNSGFYLYYLDKNKRIKITSLKKVGNRKIYSNIKPGDKIYVPPGTVLISPETNIAVRIN